ncbi:glycosyltransferase family 4 protein [Sediminibacterium roseum]|uniref:Glycosyltransferase family 4 protein n=1 Tax=Sediminibacterium roseum TaxID=1978412 RepID=A0ABW9ZZM0_9BACT|nr:glycosyltransferase family 4 protein [Sediminibacterium roseum]NCI50633.1 glycosyltransferase family 4 protein [Sediminibacterium roseum]
MIRVAMITRSTLFTTSGGDTVQVMQTAKHLRELGVLVDVKLTTEQIDYDQYSMLHFFNIIRPADILYHIHRSGKPYVVSTVFVDYSEFEKQYRSGMPGMLFSFFPADGIEYLKTISRRLLLRDSLRSWWYLVNGQRRSVKKIINNASLLLPNSTSEYDRLTKRYSVNTKHEIVTNGVDVSFFNFENTHAKNDLLVLCVARIEGIKNQLNLIKAINGTEYRLLLIGSPAPNQSSYYNACRKVAGNNVSFIGQVGREELRKYYQMAKVHVLPSWFETTGLSSLEAAVMGCNIVITDKGDTREYFGDAAFYCDPSSPASIHKAIDNAAHAQVNTSLQHKIRTMHTWQQAAGQTKNAYLKVIEQP